MCFPYAEKHFGSTLDPSEYTLNVYKTSICVVSIISMLYSLLESFYRSSKLPQSLCGHIKNNCSHSTAL